MNLLGIISLGLPCRLINDSWKIKERTIITRLGYDMSLNCLSLCISYYKMSIKCGYRNIPSISSRSLRLSSLTDKRYILLRFLRKFLEVSKCFSPRSISTYMMSFIKDNILVLPKIIHIMTIKVLISNHGY